MTYIRDNKLKLKNVVSDPAIMENFRELYDKAQPKSHTILGVSPTINQLLDGEINFKDDASGSRGLYTKLLGTLFQIVHNSFVNQKGYIQIGNIYIQYGWDSIVGTNTINGSKDITYPIVMNTLYSLHLGLLGEKTPVPNPVLITSFTGTSGAVLQVQATSPTSSGFRCDLRGEVGTTLLSTYVFGFTWLCIGV